eukprot:Gb_18065 [translate_table: standard]
MIYTAIDTFYVTDERIKNSPSRKDGIDDPTEMTLRLFGCELIQESGILLRLPQAVMATGQVLFHRFYFKRSFARFNVKRVSASCVWLAAKLEECPRKIQHILNVFHRIECRRENLPLDPLEPHSKKYADLKMDLNRMERHILKEMGFICHVEHPHKFILNYLALLGAPPEIRQEAWNLANDSLRTTLCVRFKSEVVACGVVYAAARRFNVPLPENPPWWKVFDAEKCEIDEVCKVLANLYRQPKARYIEVCKDSELFVLTNKTWDPLPDAKESPLKNVSNGVKTSSQSGLSNPESSSGRDAIVRAALDKLKESKKSDNDTKNVSVDGELREDSDAGKSKQLNHRTDATGDRSKEKDKERSRPHDRERVGEKDRERDRDRGRDWDRDRNREREKEMDREREKGKERSHRKDKGKDTAVLLSSCHLACDSRLGLFLRIFCLVILKNQGTTLLEIVIAKVPPIPHLEKRRDIDIIRMLEACVGDNLKDCKGQACISQCLTYNQKEGSFEIVSKFYITAIIRVLKRKAQSNSHSLPTDMSEIYMLRVAQYVPRSIMYNSKIKPGRQCTVQETADRYGFVLYCFQGAK